MIKAFLAAFLAAATLAVGIASPHAAAPARPAATTVPLPSRPPIHHVPPARFSVLALGDSITLGVQSTYGSGYRGPLLQLLPALTYVGSQGAAPLLDEAHSGWRIDQLLAIAPAAVTLSRPAYVLLHAGTNDAVQNHAPATMLADMAALLDALTSASPGTRVFVALIPSSPWATPAQQAAEASFDDGLPALAAARRPWVGLVDMRTTEISADGVHPDDAGYASMAEQWAAAIPEVRAS